MFKRVFRRRSAVIFAAVFASMTAFAIPSANAATYMGWTNPTGPDAGGYRYFNSSSITTDGRLYALTQQVPQTAVNVPTGYEGVLADLWKFGANNISYICDEQGYAYNDGPSNGLYVPTLKSCGKGTYYSRGVTQTFQGSGYISIYTFPTVNVTVTS